MQIQTRALHPLMLAAMLAFGAGCRSTGLDVRIIKSTAGKPGNVAVYYAVDQSNGTPVGGLKAENFHIYEDNARVSEFESKQTILNPRVAAAHYTLLLVDMSGSVSKSGQAPAVVEASSAFTEKVEKFQKVGVYAFDGSTDLYPIVPFTQSGGAAKGGVKSLAGFQPRDPSTNLNGAVIKGLETLRTELSRAEQPLKFGTLVVFTDGTDHAGRVSQDEMLNAVRNSEFDIYAIGLGAEISQQQLSDIGKNGTALAQDKEAVVKAFDQVAHNIENYTQRYYLLSYCTPARAGEHEVRLEAVVPPQDNAPELRGSAVYRFKADQYGPGCDPNTPPSFDVTKGEALRPKEPVSGSPRPVTPSPKPAPKKGALKATGSINVSPAPPQPAPEPPQPSAPGHDFNP